MKAGQAITVLVHGLWMHGVVMEFQCWSLQRMGFNAVTYSYPTMRLTLTENAARLAQFARTLAAPRIHWVGHSLGGLVILRMLERESAIPPGRVVLVGAPYAGSHAGRVLARRSWGARALGRSLSEWFNLVKPAQFPGREIGVIAGTRSFGLGRVVAPNLPRPNDGVVTVEETAMPGACDRVLLAVSHTGMLLSRSVAHQTGVFLRDGAFDHHAARA